MYHDFARFAIRNDVSNGERVRQRFDARSTEEDTRGSVRKEIANELGQQFRNVTGAYYGNAESCKRDSSEGNKRRELGSNTDDYVWKAIINLDWKRNNRNVSILRVHYIYVHTYICIGNGRHLLPKHPSFVSRSKSRRGDTVFTCTCWK